tara:strand:- start:200 stop:715 length:516 start_codon:yes stop_codon:yes gene_type:complete
LSINAESFVEILKSFSFDNIAGVPDSTFGNLFNLIDNDNDINYFRANREDTALGIASGFSISNKNSCVIMQNSGIGNIINPLTSFNLIYNIPILIIIGWRGYGGKPNDAPEHWIMGEKTPEYFEMLNISYSAFEDEFEDERKIVKRLNNEITDFLNIGESKALIIKKGVII